MYFDYNWIKDYLPEAPTLEEAAQLLNETGLETEVSGEGLEIEHTVNRPDAMCHYGVARELSVKTGTELRFPEFDESQWPDLEGWRIESDETDGCWRYMGLLIDGIDNGESPQWLKDKLDAIEQTSHGTVVDLTNFLLWELGHPSHAFDAEKIEGNEIRIRRANKGESLTTLDGKPHQVDGLLCITDQSRPIALAGVMGGENSEVDNSTESLLLELAMFDPVEVRQTAKKTQIMSDAKHRFERGVDEESMERVVRRFLYLLKQEQPHIQVKGFLDFKARDFSRESIVLRKTKVDNLLGFTIPSEEVEELLQRMDFRPEPTPQGWLVHAPGYKVDVKREVDVIEEIIRFAGLDRLPTELPAMQGSDYAPSQEVLLRQKLRRAAKENGLQEILTYSFMSGSDEGIFQEHSNPVEVRNPMSENSRVLRRDILPQVVVSASRNFARGQKDLRFFEMGHVFNPEGEVYHLACLISHTPEPSEWHHNAYFHPFFEMKGIMETIRETLTLKDLQLVPRQRKGLKDDISLSIQTGGREIGFMGALSPEVGNTYGLDVPVAVLELNLSFLKEHLLHHERNFELSAFPNIEIDMAFVVDQDVQFEQVNRFIRSYGLSDMESLGLFDVYSGKALEKGKKSLGFRFSFRSKSRTLTHDEVQASLGDVIQGVMKEFKATIRS